MTTPRDRPDDRPEPADVRETGVGWPGDRREPGRRDPAKPTAPTWAAATPQELSTRPASGTTKPAPSSTDAAQPRSSFDQAARDYRTRADQARPQQRRRTYVDLPPERPGTVTAAAVILFVSAGLGLLACCGLNYLAGEADLSDSEQTFLTVFSVITVVFSLVNVVLGYNVWEGRQWARIATIVFCVLGIGGQIFNLASGGDDTALGACLGIGLNVLVIGLLSGSQASDYFRYGRG